MHAKDQIVINQVTNHTTDLHMNYSFKISANRKGISANRVLLPHQRFQNLSTNIRSNSTEERKQLREIQNFQFSKLNPLNLKFTVCYKSKEGGINAEAKQQKLV